jgi:alpha-L-fucosidase
MNLRVNYLVKQFVLTIHVFLKASVLRTILIISSIYISLMNKVAVLFLLLISIHAESQIDPVALQEWKDLKFSMFIHFGVYSQLGGVWEGKPVSRGVSEQIQAHAGIYSDVYAGIARDFNPVKWNADSIALLAKAAGMGSIVITSKHHDGFAMYNSSSTDFDILDATPYGKDVIGELAAAAKKHKLKFGLYFSLIDWHYPQASPISSHNSDYITPEHHEFNKQQITELLTSYGVISELWFDMGSMSTEQSKEMRNLVHKLQPNCMIGSRVGNDMGDFTVMGDNQEPDYSIGVPWQSPASFFDETWGYRSWQKRNDIRDKVKEKLSSLIRVVSRGGNYLLNIGPRGDGTVVSYEKDALLQIGKWLSKNGEAIYNTNPDPFHVDFAWGSVTSRKNKLYLHLLKDPVNGTITLPGLNGSINKAYILGEQLSCAARKSADGIVIQLPKSLNVNEEFKVVVLEFSGCYTVPAINVLALNDHIELNSRNAFKFYSNSGIDYNTRYTSTIKEAWTLKPENETIASVKLFYSDEEKGKVIDLDFNGSMQAVQLDGTKQYNLENDIRALKMESVYIQGPFWSGIDGAHGPVDKIDVLRPWPNEAGKVWRIADKGDDAFVFRGDLNTAYYCLQQIESPRDQKVVAKIISGDGIFVWLNGVKKYVHNNPDKRDSVHHFLMLDLKQGKNQIIVKLFNHFHKEVPFRITYDVPQVYYMKELQPLNLKNDFFRISWKLHDPVTPHEDMGTPNLTLLLNKH